MFYIEPLVQEPHQAQSNSMFTIGDVDSSEPRSLNSEMNSLTLDEAIDPLSAATLEFQQHGGGTNSRFYNQMVNQRSEVQKQQNNTTSTTSGQSSASTTAASATSREMLNDWISTAQHAEHLKEISEAISGTIDLMLRYRSLVTYFLFISISYFLFTENSYQSRSFPGLKDRLKFSASLLPSVKGFARAYLVRQGP